MDCFLDILKSHQWNFIKPCKHNPIFKTNTYNENLRARGHVLAITVRGVSNKHCLLPFFHCKSASRLHSSDNPIFGGFNCCDSDINKIVI